MQATSIMRPDNRGFRMMEKLGFRPGEALGRKRSPAGSGGGGLTPTSTPTPNPAAASPSPDATDENGKGKANGTGRNKNTDLPDPPDPDLGVDGDGRLTAPLAATLKQGRGGIGLDALRKRQLADQAESAAKRARVEQDDFRERVRAEAEERRAEGLFGAAQRVVESFDEVAGERDEAAGAGGGGETTNKNDSSADEEGRASGKGQHHGSVGRINILYRGLMRAREAEARDSQTENSRYQSRDPDRTASKQQPLPHPDLSDLDADDKVALGVGDLRPHPSIRLSRDEHDAADGDGDGGRNGDADKGQGGDGEEDEEQDEELAAFAALPPQERLARAVRYLRERYWYCFWCKCRYDGPEMEECPGETEEEHD